VKLRRLGRLIVAYGVVVTAILVLAVLATVQTPWFKRYARDFIVRQSATILNGELQIGRVDGNFLSGLVLQDVVLRQDGTTPVRIPRATIRYSVWQLARGDAIVLDRLELTGLALSVERLPSGRLNIGALIKKRAPSTGPRRPIDIRAIQIDDAELTFDGPWGPSWMRLPRRITHLTSRLRLLSEEGHLSLPIAALRAEGFDPEFSVRTFTGILHFENDGWRVADGVLQSKDSSLEFEVSFKNTGYDVTADARTFDFPEMARIVPGLKSIDVPASLRLTMKGPQRQLDTQVTARSAAGNIVADLVLDSTVPGWHGKGHAALTAFDISRWLPTDTESSLTGKSDFDLLLGLGRHFPRGRYTFAGPHVVYAGYEARDLRTSGTLIVDRVLIDRATAVAYGSPVRAAGWIDIPEPYGFHLTGQATRLDLRRLPADVPVPHLRSSLTFEYDAVGRFRNPVLSGSATFGDSTFLDARITAGAHGAVDTSGPLVTYSADGLAANLDLNQIGDAFDLETLRKPQYAGTVSGGFNLTGAGSSLDDLTVDVKGAGITAALFGGEFTETTLDLQVRNDSLAGRGSGRFARIDPAIATEGAATGTLNGRFDLTGTMPGLFASGFLPDISALNGTLSLDASRVNAVEIESGSVAGSFDTGLASITALEARTHMGRVSGSGQLSLSRGESDFGYETEIPDAALLKDFTRIPMKGSATLKGRITGPLERTRIEGTFTGADFDAGGVSALTAAGKYTLVGPVTRLAEMTIAGEGSASFVSAFGQSFGSASAQLAYEQERLQGQVEVRLPDSRIGRVSGSMVVHAEHNELHLSDLQIELGKQRWALSAFAVGPIVNWGPTSISARGLVFDAGAGATGRITVAGELGREAPAGEVSVNVTDVALEDLPPLVPVLAGYRGRLNGTVTIAGTLKDPGISATFKIADGGVRNFSFQALEGSGRWTGDGIVGDVRVDQRPGVWLTARGSVPMDLFSSTGSKKPVDIAIRSSTIDLGLIEGVTTSVRNVVGTLEVDVTVTGQADDPRFAGFVDVKTASFEVPATGIRYRNGTVHLAFIPEAVAVEQFRLEDSKGNPLELTGTVATRALRFGDLGFELSAIQFEVLNNALGELALNGVLTIRGTLAAPVVTGDLAIHRASLDADQIVPFMQRPYAVGESAATPDSQAPAARIPGISALWDNLTLRLRLLATNNLEIRGQNIRSSRESLAGVGDVNVVFGGDLAIRKAPQEGLAVSGTLETVRGFYAYQGRRFTLEPEGTLRFAGESSLDPLLSIVASRTVSGVLIRATLRGQASAPELELTSTPALEESDILSLLLFNQPVNELALAQRDELALQAATLASGFVVSPAVSAVGQALGLDFLELEPVGTLGGTSFRLTAGREIWDGLFLTYAREFSSESYNEVLADYELTRYLRIRANASDVSGIRSRASLFRRVERAGIDLIFVFSY
jgi:autotransporter translocation and assembly factor TamB